MPEVRFGELPHGQRFFWRGREWVKIGPLLAQAKGRPEPVMLRRSTRVEVDATGTLPPAPAAGPAPGQLRELHRGIVRLAEELPLEENEKTRFLAAVSELFAALSPSSTPRG